MAIAKQHTNINEKTLSIIRHSRKSLLFDTNSNWAKNDNPDFDVTIGSYDGAEICELVGLFLLSNMKENFKNFSLGLYRFSRKMSGAEADRLRKDITVLFQSYGPEVEISCNLLQVDFLDVTFNLQTGKFSPYRKPNDTPLFTNCQWNHPTQYPCTIARHDLRQEY